MARYMEAMFITVFMHIWNILAWVFEKPKTQVRKINGIREVYGTVEKTMRGSVGPNSEIPVDYWTVVWEDEPLSWQTYACHKFQWIDGQYTLMDFKL